VVQKLNRIYGLDALRAITMYLGVVLHSTIAYKAGYHPRYWIKDPDFNSYVFDHLYFWIHSFRMPLFFLLSGFFAVILSRKIGFKSFLKNRFERIVIPLLVCVVTILPLSIAPFTFSRLYFDAGMSVTESMERTINEIWQLITFQNFKGLQHFWFLLNLIYFYLFFVASEKLGFHFENIMDSISCLVYIFITTSIYWTSSSAIIVSF
jgi:glucan biosynthesis protein C